MKITKIDPSTIRLPVNESIPGNVYEVTQNTGRAIINPRPGEIRIPFVRREEKGDFRTLIDSMVREFECRKIRFVNLQNYDILMRLGFIPADSRPLEEVAVGFKREEESWVGENGEMKGPVETLVGYWTVDLGINDPCPRPNCDETLYTNDAQTELWCMEHALIGPLR